MIDVLIMFVRLCCLPEEQGLARWAIVGWVFASYRHGSSLSSDCEPWFFKKYKLVFTWGSHALHKCTAFKNCLLMPNLVIFYWTMPAHELAWTTKGVLTCSEELGKERGKKGKSGCMEAVPSMKCMSPFVLQY